MTSEGINPNPTPVTEAREITVSVPEDRVEQFNRFVERFLSAGERGPRSGRGRGGHRGPGGHRGTGGPRGGRRARHIRKAMYHLAMAEHAHEGRGGCRGRHGDSRHGDSRHGDSVTPEAEGPAGPAETTTV
jgi:hypothetical protein